MICDQLRNAAEEHHLTYGPTRRPTSTARSADAATTRAGPTRRWRARPDNVIELDVLLYDGCRMRVGATSDEELERIVAAGRRQGQVYEQLRALRDRVADRVRPNIPTFPAASPATTSTSCSPRTASRWRARWWGPRARA